MRFSRELASTAVSVALAALAQPVQADGGFEYIGAVTLVPTALLGAGIAVGDPVHINVTLRPPLADTDPAAGVGWWTGAVASWTMTIGNFVTTGIDGDILVCDSPIPGQANCGSAISQPYFSGAYIGKDAIRFVGRALTSLPMVLNGYTQNCSGVPNGQCGTANVFDDSALALTGTQIPSALDPLAFNSSLNSGRVPFSVGVIEYSVAVVPEPSVYALLLAGLGVVGFAARRRKDAAG